MSRCLTLIWPTKPIAPRSRRARASSRIPRRDAQDGRPARSKSHFCSACRRCWDRSRRSICVPRRQSAVRLLPSARQRAYRQFHCRGRGYRTFGLGLAFSIQCWYRMRPQAHSAFEAEHDEAVFAVRYSCLGICSTTGNAWPLSGGLGRRFRSDRLERRRRQPNHGKRVYIPCLTVLAATSVTDDC
jgi:hypothetical protein